MANGLTRAEAENLQARVESQAQREAQRRDKTSVAIGFIAGKIGTRVLGGIAPAGLSPDTIALALGGYGMYKGLKNGSRKSAMWFGAGLALLSPQIDALADRVGGALSGLGGGG